MMMCKLLTHQMKNTVTEDIEDGEGDLVVGVVNMIKVAVVEGGQGVKEVKKRGQGVKEVRKEAVEIDIRVVKYQGKNKSIQVHRKIIIVHYDEEKFQTLTTKNELCADASRRIQTSTKDETSVSTLKLKGLYLTSTLHCL